MLIDDPSELLFQPLLGTSSTTLLLYERPNIMLDLLELQLGIDNFLLLRLEIPLEIRELIVESNEVCAFRLELLLSCSVIALLVSVLASLIHHEKSWSIN